MTMECMGHYKERGRCLTEIDGRYVCADPASCYEITKRMQSMRLEQKTQQSAPSTRIDEDE